MENILPNENKILLLTAPVKEDVKPSRKTEAEYAEIFELYALWKSLPVIHLKKMSPDQLFKEMGIEDERIHDLMMLRTQGDFADKYHIEQGTLSDWNKRIGERDPLQEVKQWAQPLVKNLVLSMYAHAIKKGDYYLTKLFLQTMNDWTEKVSVENKHVTVAKVIISTATPNEIEKSKQELKNRP